MSKLNDSCIIGLIQHQPKKTTLKTALKELTKPKSAIMTEPEAETPAKSQK